MTRKPPAFDMIAQSLNEYADAWAAGEGMEGHTPADPVYWFCGIFHETEAVWDTPAGRAKLNANAVDLIETMREFNARKRAEYAREDAQAATYEWAFAA